MMEKTKLWHNWNLLVKTLGIDPFNLTSEKVVLKTEVSCHRPYCFLHNTYITVAMAELFVLPSKECYYYQHSVL